MMFAESGVVEMGALVGRRKQKKSARGVSHRIDKSSREYRFAKARRDPLFVLGPNLKR